MARVIEQLKNDNLNVVLGISENFASDIYDCLKKEDEQLAIYFMEQWRFAKITGHLMAR
ncbi:MAG: hypothetical protein MJZ37_00085 [Bacilli bacterium]|nr:hypothetical protein [Bacilli bacterium]